MLHMIRDPKLHVHDDVTVETVTVAAKLTTIFSILCFACS